MNNSNKFNIEEKNYDTKSKVESDDYININDKPRSNIEKIWVKYREENFNTDTLNGSFINR